MCRSYKIEIISGGQTGVDRAALDVAINLGIPHSGWCPCGREAEDGIISNKYNLKEAPAPMSERNLDPDAIYKIRTELNARDSDGTLIILKDDPIGGTLYTIEVLQKYSKPCFMFDLSKSYTIADIINWMMKYNVHKLNVAGPRESQTPGIYNSAYGILEKLLTCQLFYKNHKENPDNERTVRAKL